MKPWHVERFTPGEWDEMTTVLTERAREQKKAENEARRQLR